MKLTKEEAEKLITDIHNYKVANRCACPDPDNSEYKHSWNCMYDALNEKGWIEKSAVDEFYDYYNFNNPNPYVLYDKATKAIEELQEKLKIKEE